MDIHLGANDRDDSWRSMGKMGAAMPLNGSRIVLICGGRDYTDEATMKEICTRFLAPGDTLIHGNAPGADRLAEKCARRMKGVTIKRYPVTAGDWDQYGKAAGPIRNQKMLDEGTPDLVIAMPGGKGTTDMMNRAKSGGIRTIWINKGDAELNFFRGSKQ